MLGQLLKKHAGHLGSTAVRKNRYRHFCICLAPGRACILSGGKKVIFGDMREQESYSKAVPTGRYTAALPGFWWAPVVPRALASSAK